MKLSYSLLMLALMLLFSACTPRTQTQTEAKTEPQTALRVIATPEKETAANPAIAITPSRQIVTQQDNHTLMSQAANDPNRQAIPETVIPQALEAVHQVNSQGDTTRAVLARVEMNKRLYYSSINADYISPLEVTLLSLEQRANHGLELNYSIFNPSNERRILDPRGLRSDGNYVRDASGRRFEASSSLLPVIIPAGSTISYTVSYNLEEMMAEGAVEGTLKQLTVFSGLDDVSEDVASTLASFAVAFPEQSDQKSN